MVTASTRNCAVSVGEDARDLRRREQHERELAALREQHRRSRCASSLPRLRDAQMPYSSSAFNAISPSATPSTARGMRAKQREIGAHPDRHEEEPHQQPLERLDVGFELVAELGIGEQHAGEERAERHRQADRLHQQRGADDDEQRGRGEHFAAAEARDELQRRAGSATRLTTMTSTIAATPFAASIQPLSRAGLVGARAAAGARSAESPPDPGTAGSRTRAVRSDSTARRARRATRARSPSTTSRGRSRRRWPPARRNRARARRTANATPVTSDLRAAQPEHGLAQRPQPRRLELQPDQEQQQHHAELGEAQRCLRVADDAEPPRADERAGGEVAQHRAELAAAGRAARRRRRSRERSRRVPEAPWRSLFRVDFARLSYPEPGARTDQRCGTFWILPMS